MTTDLFREFQWSGNSGALVQVAFPGMYPDLTRWQAETDQGRVNQGQDAWKLDAVKTAQHFVAQFLAQKVELVGLLTHSGFIHHVIDGEYPLLHPVLMDAYFLHLNTISQSWLSSFVVVGSWQYLISQQQERVPFLQALALRYSSARS